MVEPLRHRQTKGAETDMPGLQPLRHTSTLPLLSLKQLGFSIRFLIQRNHDLRLARASAAPQSETGQMRQLKAVGARRCSVRRSPDDRQTDRCLAKLDKAVAPGDVASPRAVDRSLRDTTDFAGNRPRDTACGRSMPDFREGERSNRPRLRGRAKLKLAPFGTLYEAHAFPWSGLAPCDRASASDM